MPGMQLNGLVTLRSPVLHEDAELGSFNTYLASWKNGGHEFAFSIAQPIKHVKAPLLPHGTTADVDATLTLHNNSLLLTATNVTGLYLATSNSLRAETNRLFQPTLNVAGKIARIHPPDLRFPGVQAVDLLVEAGGLWPYHDTTLVAYFNREELRLRLSVPLLPDMSLSLVGVLCGWVNGTIAMDVDDFKFNNDGPLPEAPLATLPNLFQKLNIVSDFAQFSDPSRLPPLAARPSSFANVNSSSLRWLETIAPLGAGDAAVNGVAARPANVSPRAERTRRSSSPSAVVPTTIRRRRGTPRPERRTALAPLDANIPEFETVDTA
ncbi:hypothetical protein AURDEDRAFT_128832 [Auricularia subglabra TFB-10046 SS5]|nr:hypothetical protein AURDEDRAFT_128832 [Auricularia subglabra TFB-10046 SS5]